MFIKRTIYSKTTVLLLVFFLILLAILKYKQYTTEKEIDAEIAKLKNQISSIQKENGLLRDNLEFLESNDFKQLNAKQFLNLKKEGEKVFSIQLDKTTDEVEKLIPEKRGNWKENANLWFRFLTSGK